MAIDWTTIAGNLLGSATPVSAVAGAIEQAGKLANHFIKDPDPVAVAKAERAYYQSMLTYSEQAKEAKSVEELDAIIVNFDTDLESK